MVVSIWMPSAMTKHGRAIEVRGYRVLRFWNDDVLLRTEDVMETICRHLGVLFPRDIFIGYRAT